MYTSILEISFKYSKNNLFFQCSGCKKMDKMLCCFYANVNCFMGEEKAQACKENTVLLVPSIISICLSI